MSVAGQLDPWGDTFPEALVPEILKTILSAWQRFEKPLPDAHEVPMTRRFRVALIHEKGLRRLPVRIEREVPEDDLETGEERGRIDLKLSAAGSAREDVYLSFECKRLNVRTSGRLRSLAGAYVIDGIMRFVDARYAFGQSHAGMIGYVMDGRVEHAAMRVGSAIQRDRVLLRLSSDGLVKSTILPGAEVIRETRHQLDAGLLALHHVFLAC
ncbi:MAG: hypothetical protein HC897_13655 [Thermoanaerobaculia bacterium]|nr:hypothetical protein [Thermoanaerobaculia bacterium]